MLSAMSGSSSMISIKGFIKQRVVGGRWLAPGGWSAVFPNQPPGANHQPLSGNLTMFDHQSFGHINDQLADVCDVIADALEVFGDHQQPGGAPGRRRVARHPVEQVVKDAVVE